MQGEKVAIDYQQILMDMNRPSRRQGSGLKKLFFVLFLFLVLGGGAYALWYFGIVNKAYEKASGLVAGVWGDSSAQTGTPAESSAGGVALDVAAANNAVAAPAQSLRPQAPAQPQQVPAPEGPIDLASMGNSTPSLTERVVAPPTSQPVVSAPPVDSQPVRAVAAPPASSMRPVVSQAPAVPVSAGPDMAPTPILSDAKAQIKVIDQMLTSNPAEAMQRIEMLMGSANLEPDEAAEAGYRLGYAARMLRDEEKAERSWKETAEKWPTLRGGRFSALALADTWYRRYAGERPQISYWDDVQLMYSRVLGEDDAPFLPDNVKKAVKANIGRLNDALFFGSAPTKLARYHKVESGELLGSIANKYRVDYESIARINGINPNRIRVGMDLKVIVGDVSIVVRKNETEPNKTPTVTWFLDGRWMREYPACVGDGIKTPAGTYQLTSKERDPSWTNPLNGQLLSNDHPDNILGSRWMAMKGMNTQGLGIHGTTVDDSIPGYTSAGCVRLHNLDVEELFSFARITNKVTVLE